MLCYKLNEFCDSTDGIKYPLLIFVVVL